MARLIELTDVAGNVRLFNPDHIVDVVYVETLEQIKILANGYRYD